MTGARATTDWGSELTHILVVRDIAAAVAFYRDVLGATVRREYGGTLVRAAALRHVAPAGEGGDPTDDKPTVTVRGAAPIPIV